jgi:hypothetical protein
VFNFITLVSIEEEGVWIAYVCSFNWHEEFGINIHLAWIAVDS